jgi:ATP:corrinoid adenosyltransferase
MQRKKAHIDARIKEADINKGIIVLLTGNGKGKSSSAFGMVCRALGHELQVAIVKFLKGTQDTGEDAFFAKQENIHTTSMQAGFTSGLMRGASVKTIMTATIQYSAVGISIIDHFAIYAGKTGKYPYHIYAGRLYLGHTRQRV